MLAAGLERKFNNICNTTHPQLDYSETFSAPKVSFSGATGSLIPGAEQSC
jgi:hypothetical protein